jgi:hypothetical protein
MAEHRHGNTPAAWAACTIIMVAFLLGTIAVVIANWYLFWIGGVALAIAGVVVGWVMAGMGYGKEPKRSADEAEQSATTPA